MTDTTAVEHELRDELDAVLKEMTLQDNLRKKIQQDLNAANAHLTSLEGESQRLRMALFALEGNTRHGLGDANIANGRRRRELADGAGVE